MNIKTETVTIPNQDLSIKAYLATPDTAEEKFPAVIVIQEIFGVNDHIKDVTRRIAQEGYVAISPAIYQRQAPDFEVGYTSEDVQIGRVYKNQTKASELLSDIQATIKYLYSLPQVINTGVGTIGFCFGGHIAYLVATLPDIKVTASFYGAGITNWCPGEDSPTITKTKDIVGKIYCFFGEKDASIPIEQVEQIKAELQKYNIEYQVFIYPQADHGFFCDHEVALRDRRVSYHQESAESAWLIVLELFKEL